MIPEFPLHDDQLFRHDLPDWTSNAMIGYQLDTFPTYADGYRDAAQALIEKCLTEQRGNDVLIYPVVYLYRQYIELRMKEIIITIQYCKGEQKHIPPTHKIEELWRRLKTGYASLDEPLTDETIQNAERLILEFADIDPQSMAFRYPVNLKGEKMLSLTHINIRNFGEVMSRLACLLDALSDQVAHYADLANDMFREWYMNQDNYPTAYE